MGLQNFTYIYAETPRTRVKLWPRENEDRRGVREVRKRRDGGTQGVRKERRKNERTNFFSSNEQRVEGTKKNNKNDVYKQRERRKEKGENEMDEITEGIRHKERKGERKERIKKTT